MSKQQTTIEQMAAEADSSFYEVQSYPLGHGSETHAIHATGLGKVVSAFIGKKGGVTVRTPDGRTLNGRAARTAWKVYAG